MLATQSQPRRSDVPQRRCPPRHAQVAAASPLSRYLLQQFRRASRYRDVRCCPYAARGFCPMPRTALRVTPVRSAMQPPRARRDSPDFCRIFLTRRSPAVRSAARSDGERRHACRNAHRCSPDMPPRQTPAVQPRHRVCHLMPAVTREGDAPLSPPRPAVDFAVRVATAFLPAQHAVAASAPPLIFAAPLRAIDATAIDSPFDAAAWLARAHAAARLPRYARVLQRTMPA